MENVVSNIKAFRKARGITQAELAEISGLHVNAISSIETGAKHPTLKSVIAIYEALGIKLTLTYEAIGLHQS